MRRAPEQDGRPAVLRLALALAPAENRVWLEDMADEYVHVARPDRLRWLLGALSLALRWRLATWRRVPAPHFAIAVMALALLVGSPWLLRRYTLQSLPAVDEITRARDNVEGGAPPAATDPEFQEPAAGADAETRAAPAAPALRDRDETGAAATEPDPAAENERDDGPAATAGGDDRLDAATAQEMRQQPAAAPADAAAPDEPTAPADGLAAAPDAVGAAAANDQTAAGVPVLEVAGNTVQLTALRATRVVIRGGDADDGEPLVDREVEAGERFLLVLPVLVTAADGGALEVGTSGPLGADGEAVERRFVAATPREEP